MHEPHSSGVRRITHFVRVEVVMILTQHLTRVQLFVVLSPTAEPNEPARLVNV